MSMLDEIIVGREFLQNSRKSFVTRTIDKFSRQISTRGIILVVEGRACDNTATTSQL